MQPLAPCYLTMGMVEVSKHELSNADSKIDIHDPNFWDLVLPEAKTAERLMQKLDKDDSLTTEEQRIQFLS